MTNQLTTYRTLSITSFIHPHQIIWAAKRAGNPKSNRISDRIPNSLFHLRDAAIGSGHDTWLKGVTVDMDIICNKQIREQLLRYNFINVVSSCSLMHNIKALIEVGKHWEDVDDGMREAFFAYKESLDEEDPQYIEKICNNLPLGFAYPLSITTNLLQLKTIEHQRKGHKLSFWMEMLLHISLINQEVERIVQEEKEKNNEV